MNFLGRQRLALYVHDGLPESDYRMYNILVALLMFFFTG